MEIQFPQKGFDAIWEERLRVVSFAYQPIVNIHTGVCFGVEALLRCTEEAGFSSIQQFFDVAFAEGVLHQVDLALREKAIAGYCQISFAPNLKLFFNLDNRLMQDPSYLPGSTQAILERAHLHSSILCFEISERHEVMDLARMNLVLNHYKQQGFRIAVDDFGSGYAGLQLLYRCEPHTIKIDRFFITEVCRDARKKLFVQSIVGLAHTLGIQVVAEGVETPTEFLACREIGCDYVQGYLVQRPTLAPSEIVPAYGVVERLVQADRRRSGTDEKLIREQMIYVSPLCHPLDRVSKLFEAFRENKRVPYIPIVNTDDEPLGIVHERELKEYVYSPYGKELLKNRSLGKHLMDFASTMPRVEVTMSLEKVLEVFSLDSQTHQAECVLITENGRYCGLLTAATLLSALNEKNVSMARDLNPLSRLPGNRLISDQISQLASLKGPVMLAWFDFDHFKPFNDRYGFRLGDRVIQVFADLLREAQLNSPLFVGHIGGDDFFAALPGGELEPIARRILVKFRETVRTIQLPEFVAPPVSVEKNSGGVPLVPALDVSVALLRVADPKLLQDEELLSIRFGQLKKAAKASTEHVALGELVAKARPKKLPQPTPQQNPQQNPQPSPQVIPQASPRLQEA